MGMAVKILVLAKLHTLPKASASPAVKVYWIENPPVVISESQDIKSIPQATANIPGSLLLLLLLLLWGWKQNKLA